mmetsp:Transcript_5636/g.16624  ORF Transcript_5636/g.16624 Transcript_5636/m.16624 type:complete len:506 (-) Transcript_5636:78-1595(-)
MASGRRDWLGSACTLAGVAAGSFLLGTWSAGRRGAREGEGGTAVGAASTKLGPATTGADPTAAATSSSGAAGAATAARRAAANGAADEAGGASVEELLSFLSQLPPKPIGAPGTKPQDTHSTAKAVLLCASGKGGVGKSTVSVNLAYTLAGFGLEVGLLDLDVYGPSLPELICLPSVQVMLNAAGRIVPLDYGGVALMSWGYIQPGEASTIRAPIFAQIVSQLLTGVEWGNLDVLVVDSPPGTGDVLLSLSQTLTIDGAILVTTCNNISFADVLKGVQLFEKVEIPPMLVVANMATFSCEQCGHSHELFTDSACTKLPKFLESQGIGLVRMPLDPLLSMTPDRPIPPLARAYPFVRNSDNEGRPSWAAFNELARRVLQQLLAPSSGRSGGSSDRVTLKLRAGGALEVRLRGGELRALAPCELRATCRCAECVDDMTGEVKIDKVRIRADLGLRATAVEPRGNYAVSVSFSDGHCSLVALRALERLTGGESASVVPAAARSTAGAW